MKRLILAACLFGLAGCNSLCALSDIGSDHPVADPCHRHGYAPPPPLPPAHAAPPSKAGAS